MSLDVEELMHLATRAIERDDAERAIDYLKRLLEISPDDGPALYLLGAVHAGIGMHERAISEIGRALELEPDIPVARFQLGLLHATTGAFDAARETWRPLEALGESDPLFLFKRGMEHYLDDRYADCAADLERGIALNTDNDSLNDDISNILAHAREAIEEGESEPSAGSGRHRLAAYRSGELDTEG